MIKYRLFSVLGEGGGGRVYRALDLVAGVEVAIKVLHDGWDRTTVMRREIASLLAYSHPNIVKLLDTTTVDGAPALVLELAEKGELSRYLQEPLPVRLALTLGRQIADALCLIHASGGAHERVGQPNELVWRRYGTRVAAPCTRRTAPWNACGRTMHASDCAMERAWQRHARVWRRHERVWRRHERV